MKSNRRKFISTTLAGGLAAAIIPLSSHGSGSTVTDIPTDIENRYSKLDEILKQPVLKRELFTSPVIIESVELLHYENKYLCRVRTTDGAEGISVAHGDMFNYFPIFLEKLQPFFIGKDARDLDLILERILFFRLNFRLNGIAIGIPLATIEFAILDMLGKIAGKSMGELVGEIHNKEIGIYVATEFRSYL